MADRVWKTLKTIDGFYPVEYESACKTFLSVNILPPKERFKAISDFFS